MLGLRLLLPAAAVLGAAGSGGGGYSQSSVVPPGPSLRELAAKLRPPLLIGSDLVDTCPNPLTGRPDGACGPKAKLPNK
jgi:hypothetical protein